MVILKLLMLRDEIKENSKYMLQALMLVQCVHNILQNASFNVFTGLAVMESKTSLGRGVRPLQGGGGIFKSAAVAVLRTERRLMTTGEITK